MTDVILVRGIRHEIHECLTCGCVIVASERLLENMREKGGYYHCQNGHSQGWSKEASEIERLRRERDRLKQNNARLVEETAAAERAVQRAKTELVRHKKRSAAGLCPCCNRSFVNMRRHMKTKHPDYNVVPLKAAP